MSPCRSGARLRAPQASSRRSVWPSVRRTRLLCSSVPSLTPHTLFIPFVAQLSYLLWALLGSLCSIWCNTMFCQVQGQPLPLSSHGGRDTSGSQADDSWAVLVQACELGLYLFPRAALTKFPKLDGLMGQIPIL